MSGYEMIVKIAAVVFIQSSTPCYNPTCNQVKKIVDMISQKVQAYIKNGVLLFNQKAFFHAHEYFEDAWQETPDDSREFYRALLQISGGHFRLTQNRPTAAKKFFNRAFFWLESFSDNYLGFDVTNISQYLHRLNDSIDQHMPPRYILEELFQPLHSNIIINDEE